MSIDVIEQIILIFIFFSKYIRKLIISLILKTLPILILLTNIF